MHAGARMIALASAREVRPAIPRQEQRSATWLATARQRLDPLLVIPFGLIAAWGVLSAGTIATLSNLPIGGRGRVREPPAVEAIVVIAPPTPEQATLESASTRDEVNSAAEESPSPQAGAAALPLIAAPR